MLTDCAPDEFCALRDGKRFKSFGEIKSETGHTVYIGSRSSDRYARVYRYTEPHPRAHLLRSEFVLKGEQAKLAARELLAVGVDLYAARLGNSFGWKHKVWLPNEWSVEEAKAWRPDREAGNTVRWLYSQVAPALIKLHREGQLDAQIWFAEAVLNSIVYPLASENDAPPAAVE
jgi:DNA relaxase NicK